VDIDVLVVGAGVVGLAVARELQLAGREVVLADAESQFGMHTSSRNSEVIHAGIYYAAGSLKARFCVRGKALLYDYCASRGVPHNGIGKLIVATEDGEEAALDGYRAKAEANGVDDLRPVSLAKLQELEPEVTARAALFSPSTGIIDSHAYMQALLTDFEAAGGVFARRCAVTGAVAESTGFTVILADGERIRVRSLVNSAGIEAPALAATIAGLDARHVPARRFAIGHYYTLAGRSPFRHLIYPLPVPGALGIHVTLDLAGGARFGPDIRWVDAVDYGFDDSRRGDFAAAIRRYYPAVSEEDLVPAYTGIRPKIVVDGAVLEDFVISGPEQHGMAGLVNLFGVESPGLTSSLAIAEAVRPTFEAMGPG
jgi:L-2-hydroxyglutarate oxidase LhgO